MNDLYSILSLVSVPGLGPHRIRSLVGHFGSSQAVLNAGIKELSQVENIDEKIAHNIKRKVDHAFANHQLSLIEKHKIKLITYWDKEYPAILRKIYDPPVLLYVKGSLWEDGENGIGVVGTRTASQYGRWVAERFGEDLARVGVTVVSGMARGIDSCAHRGAIKGGGKTVAVLGCGLDIIYPPENQKLYEQIAENGAVISEFPIGTEPVSAYFPRRNRIISGLSLGTVVVEAGGKSGALITAYMALDQGREVFAVPGSIRSFRSKGTHKLIKEGAKLVENVEDILAEIPELKVNKERKEKRGDLVKLLSDKEKILWEVLSEEPLHIDKIALDAKMETSETLALLLSLELKNFVKQLSGMMFVRQ